MLPGHHARAATQQHNYGAHHALLHTTFAAHHTPARMGSTYAYGATQHTRAMGSVWVALARRLPCAVASHNQSTAHGRMAGCHCVRRGGAVGQLTNYAKGRHVRPLFGLLANNFTKGFTVIN